MAESQSSGDGCFMFLVITLLVTIIMGMWSVDNHLKSIDAKLPEIKKEEK